MHCAGMSAMYCAGMSAPYCAGTAVQAFTLSGEVYVEQLRYDDAMAMFTAVTHPPPQYMVVGRAKHPANPAAGPCSRVQHTGCPECSTQGALSASGAQGRCAMQMWYCAGVGLCWCGLMCLEALQLTPPCASRRYS